MKMRIARSSCVFFVLFVAYAVFAEPPVADVVQSARDSGDRLTHKAPIRFGTSHVSAPVTVTGTVMKTLDRDLLMSK